MKGVIAVALLVATGASAAPIVRIETGFGTGPSAPSTINIPIAGLSGAALQPSLPSVSLTGVGAPALQIVPSAVPSLSVPAIAANPLSAPAAIESINIAAKISPSMAAATPRDSQRVPESASALRYLAAPSIGDGWDGGRQYEEEEEHAYAERREREAEQVQHAHADIPVVDYRRGAYEERSAREFMDSVQLETAEKSFTGRELLSWLVTPEALLLDRVPDPERMDFSRLGHSSTRLRRILEEKSVPYHPYEAMLGRAFRDGLVYRLTDARRGVSYTGVPYEVRSAFGLREETPASPAAAPAAAPVDSAFAKALLALTVDAEKLPKSEELFEFTAQVVAAAEKAGLLPAGSGSEKFRARAAKIDFDVPPLRDAVETLAESAEGTPWEARAAALLALLDKK